MVLVLLALVAALAVAMIAFDLRRRHDDDDDNTPGGPRRERIPIRSQTRGPR